MVIVNGKQEIKSPLTYPKKDLYIIDTNSHVRIVARNSQMRKWNSHGWDRFSGHNPQLNQAKNDLLRLLERAPDPHQSKWDGWLKGKLDHLHFSAILELYLYNFFIDLGYGVAIEPDLQGINNRPDFLLTNEINKLLVEAKTVLDRDSVSEQEMRLYELADGLTGKLKRTVSIHPYKKLPPISLPGKQIASAIESRASKSEEEVIEFRIADEHHGHSYDLEVTIVLDQKPTDSTDVGSTSILYDISDVGERVRREIIKKAKKYGNPEVPFVIAVWPKITGYNSDLDDASNDDSIALAGDHIWDFNRLVKIRKPNGFFTLLNQDGTPRYSRVSAVLFYQFKWGEGPFHNLRVYHNPHAKHRMDSHVFSGIPQARVNLNTGKLEWE